MESPKWLQLPSSILLAVLAFAATIPATAIPAPTPTGNLTQKQTIATTGSGPDYASACWQAQISYNAASSSWTSAKGYVSTTTEIVGGPSVSEVTYYENATTLCDGHARVTYSPAISLSTGTITSPGGASSTSTIFNTYFPNFPMSLPTCSIKPSDCDGLWKAYSTSLSAAGGQTTSPPLETPPCLGESAASSYAVATSEIYGCGKCTIYGEGVELVYFPTSPTSRDMCASTPTASLTHYGSDAVITAYAGKSSSGEGDSEGKKVVVADGHTFTSGTAYISISTVYAVDRCSKTFGTPIKDAILAMPSESVLSLRYSQDHFQQLMETDKVTGYPVSYADFNTPIPWSAWNGQNMCDPGGYGGWACSIVYENSFRPQLAIPPQITELSPEFKNCQMWYNGLWDPPLALTEAADEAKPTAPGGYDHHSSAAARPSSALASPTSAPTALPNNLPSTGGDGSDAYPTSAGGPTLPASRPTSYNPAGEPWIHSFHAGSHTYWATGANGQVHIGTATLTNGGPAQTLQDGTEVSYGHDGLALKGSSTASFDDPSPAMTTGSGAGSGADPDTVVITVDGDKATAVQSSDGGPVVIGSSITLTPGSATTLSDGEILSCATNGVVVEWTSTLGEDQETGSGSASATTTQGSSKEGSSGTSSSSSSGDAASSTGSASTMSAAQALSLFAAIIAVVIVGG